MRIEPFFMRTSSLGRLKVLVASAWLLGGCSTPVIIPAETHTDGGAGMSANDAGQQSDSNAAVDAMGTNDGSSSCGPTNACSTPPPSTCADPKTLRTYATGGTCTAGACTYAATM